MKEKVLVIEDTATHRKIIETILEKANVTVQTAESGREGIEKARLWKPDLILLDLVLPDMDGFTVCAEIKRKSDLPDTVVVVLSVKDSVDDIIKAFQEGAADYIVKPLIPDLLIQKLKLYLKRDLQN